MKFFARHLMPYQHLDFVKASKHNSYWIEFPNTFFDPKLGSELGSRGGIQKLDIRCASCETEV